MYCNHPPKCVLRLLKKSSKRLGVQCMVLCIKFMTFDITGLSIWHQPKRMHYFEGNLSKLPYICSVWSPQTGNLMIPAFKKTLTTANSVGLLMVHPANHMECKPKVANNGRNMEKLPINWCRISISKLMYFDYLHLLQKSLTIVHYIPWTSFQRLRGLPKHCQQETDLKPPHVPLDRIHL